MRKVLPLLVANVVISVLVVFAALALQGPRDAADIARSRATAPEPGTVDVPQRLRDLDARVSVLEVSVASSGSEFARLRDEMRADREAARAELAALRALVEGDAAAAVEADVEVKPPEKPDLDNFAREVSRAMRQNISQEFKRISDLILTPTPEAEQQRRRQLEMVAQMFGRQAGLDDAQLGTLQQILVDTDTRARDELRPVLQATDDYTKLDYTKIKSISANAFSDQDSRFDEAFPEDKAKALKQSVAPIRTLFSAMLDDLEKQGKATTEGGGE